MGRKVSKKEYRYEYTKADRNSIVMLPENVLRDYYRI